MSRMNSLIGKALSQTNPVHFPAIQLYRDALLRPKVDESIANLRQFLEATKPAVTEKNLETIEDFVYVCCI